MGKKQAIAASAVVLIAGVVVLCMLLPKRYQTAERLSQATIFWNDKEAFVFLDIMRMGRGQNVIQRRIASSDFGLFSAFFSGFGFSEQQVVAYHLLDSGALEHPELPANATLYGAWKLVNGNLQLTTTANQFRSFSGFRWSGNKFEAVPPEPISAVPKITNLSSDDEEEEDASPALGIADKKERGILRDAGWHWKELSGYQASGDAALAMTLGGATFDLFVHSSPRQQSTEEFDFLANGANELEISGGSLRVPVVLWQNSGWQEISKQDYAQHSRKNGRTPLPMSLWFYLAVIALFLVWKVSAWEHVIYSFASVKKRVVKNVPTSYSFPPALPSQFPHLDMIALERYTREWERLGFERLIDTAPVSDAPNHPATFCRLLVHTRHHCFAQVTQIFPRGKAVMPMKSTVISYLQDGWSMGFGDRKPLPGAALTRRPKSLGVSMPDSTPADLLQSMLRLREQVCLDLGISPLTNDTLEAYIAKTQQTAKDIRAAVQQKNFLTGVPQYYYRKLGLMRTKLEYVWLGDYPTIAEQRKQAGELVGVR